MDSKNLILAIVASLAILLGWQTLVEQPKQEQAAAEERRLQEAAGRDPNSIGVPGVPAPGQTAAKLTAAEPRDRDEIIAESDRITVDGVSTATRSLPRATASRLKPRPIVARST